MNERYIGPNDDPFDDDEGFLEDEEFDPEYYDDGYDPDDYYDDEDEEGLEGELDPFYIEEDED